MSYNYADLFFCTTRNEITNILLTTNFQTLVTLAGTISNSPNHKTFNSHKAYTHFIGLQIHHLQIDNLGLLVSGDNEVNAVWVLDSVVARDHP